MFRVEWAPEALNELADLWVQAGPGARQAITAAAEALDRKLQADPFRESESRGEDDERRVQFSYPLASRFKGDSRHHLVRVSHVRRFRRRGEPGDS